MVHLAFLALRKYESRLSLNPYFFPQAWLWLTPKQIRRYAAEERVPGYIEKRDSLKHSEGLSRLPITACGIQCLLGEGSSPMQAGSQQTRKRVPQVSKSSLCSPYSITATSAGGEAVTDAQGQRR